MEVYKHPLYYETAFSFFDVKEQIDTFEEIMRKYSRVAVDRCLDIACGPSSQLRELAKRGYKAVGLDLAPEMLRYLSGKAEEEGLEIETLQADMSSFRLGKKVDYVFVMMGSLVFASDEEFLNHLDSVACSLRRGGLYFIQNKAVDWIGIDEQRWNMEREGIRTKTTFNIHWKSLLNQTYTEELGIDVDDHGQTINLKDEEDLKFIFPEEFKTLVRLNGEFDFLGWWEGTESTWYMDRPLEKAKSPSNINMVLLRRK